MAIKTKYDSMRIISLEGNVLYKTRDLPPPRTKSPMPMPSEECRRRDVLRSSSRKYIKSTRTSLYIPISMVRSYSAHRCEPFPQPHRKQSTRQEQPAQITLSVSVTLASILIRYPGPAASLSPTLPALMLSSTVTRTALLKRKTLPTRTATPSCLPRQVCTSTQSVR